MALTAKELRHKAKKNQARMQEILTASTESLSAEHEKEFDALDADAEKFLKQADKIEKMESRELEKESETAEELSQPKGKTLDSLKPAERTKMEDLAIRSYLKSGIVPVELRALMAPSAAEKDDSNMISKALKEMGFEGLATQTTTTTAGGYTIPRGFQAELEKAILEYGGMWESSRIIKTEKGNTIDWPTTNDTANKAYLLAESTSAATSAQALVFGQQQFEAYKYTSGLVQVPTELLQDSEFDISSLMVETLAERIWRGTNEAFTTADGSSKPKGISAGAVYGVSSENDTALSYNDFVNLEHSVDPGYRKQMGAGWMFHDTVLKEAKKIKDSQGNPIWTPGLMAEGAPSRILGYKYHINQDMPIFWPGNAADNDTDKAVLFGALKKYIIRQVRDMRIVRLNERYGELDQTAFVVFLRVDGDLLNAGTNPVKYLRVSAT
jgi:HK97 family phage major capsid protein